MTFGDMSPGEANSAENRRQNRRLAPLAAKLWKSDPSVPQSSKPIKENDTVHGPALTPHQAVTSVARHVRRLEAQGLVRDQAVRLAAAETAIDPTKVRWCVETVFPRLGRPALTSAQAAPRRRGPPRCNRVALARCPLARLT